MEHKLPNPNLEPLTDGPIEAESAAPYVAFLGALGYKVIQEGHKLNISEPGSSITWHVYSMADLKRRVEYASKEHGVKFTKQN